MPKLFETFPQHREEIAIWKLMHGLDFWEYANNMPVRWVALNIPMNVFGKNGFEGDIDMLFSLSSPPAPGFLPPYVRSYEVKTATIDGSGKIKSFDNDKFEHAVKQCEKLKKFGAELIHLIEYIILEPGKIIPQHSMGKVIKKINDRSAIIGKLSFGYNIKFKQYFPDSDEYVTSTYVPSFNPVHGKFLSKSEPFTSLTGKLNDIASGQSVRGIKILYLCKICRQIATTSSTCRNHECNHCGAVLKVYD